MKLMGLDEAINEKQRNIGKPDKGDLILGVLWIHIVPIMTENLGIKEFIEM